MDQVTPALPESVRKQGEDADALHRKMYPEQYPKADGAQPGKQPDAAKPEEGKETPAPKPAEPAKPAEVKVEGTAEEWKQRYLTLDGKYKAEVPQLHATAAALRNQLQESLTRIQTLETEKAQATTGKDPDKEKGNGAGDEVTDPTLKAFQEEYPDIFEAVKKMIPKSAEAPKPAAPKPDATPAPASDARQTMLYFLGRDIPDWKDINRDPAFIQSLEAPDPLTGMKKLDALNLAYNANDFTSVIGFFRDYKAAKSAGGGPPAPDAGKENTGPDGKPLTEEEKALAPPKGKRAPESPQGDQTLVTPQDLAKFYDEARRGLWGPITEEKYRKEEARLLAALMKSKK